LQNLAKSRCLWKKIDFISFFFRQLSFINIKLLMVINALIVAAYIFAAVLADFPSAVLFSGLDTFRLMVTNGTPALVCLAFMGRMIVTAATGHLVLFAIASLQPRFSILANVPGLVTFAVIVCAQPLVQLFLRIRVANNKFGFALSWVKHPALHDPLLLVGLAVMLSGLFLTTYILGKYQV
jgi:hypothetical protein